jgi:alpha/beta superfamily hydrolase
VQPHTAAKRSLIPGPAGQLETLLWTPRDGSAPRAAAVVCHPHPLGGGTMDNKVVFRIARGLQTASIAVLRFNFRGVGASEGAHDGKAEEDDAKAALDHLAARFPRLPLWGAGFSFGARTIASLATREPRIQRLLLVALPTKSFDCTMLPELAIPAHVLLAGRDEFGNAADLRERFPALGANVTLDEVPDVDHFFTGRTQEVEARARAWAEGALAALPPSASDR